MQKNNHFNIGNHARIGRKIKEARKQRGVALIHLARAASVKIGCISGIERGSATTVNTLSHICRELNVPITWITGAEEAMPEEKFHDPDVRVGELEETLDKARLEYRKLLEEINRQKQIVTMLCRQRNSARGLVSQLMQTLKVEE